MYLAPLNYNRFFERVFREIAIVKRFLEDILNVRIEEIEPLPRKHQMTDDAALVEFDYRCKINGQYVIVDMQQWYKRDVIKRFYLYFCNNTSLQLEHLKPVNIPMPNGKTYKTKTYEQLEPSITLVWMVDDNLGFSDDMVAYSMFPEVVSTFMHDDILWNKEDVDSLFKRRAEVLKVMDSKHKNLDFLSKNRLIYMFQSNIIRNKTLVNKALSWFEFASKTKNPNNVAADFKKFSKDPIFSKVMEKLKTSVLSEDDFEYVTDFEAYAVGVQNYNDSIRREVMQDVQWLVKQAEQDARRAEQAKQQAEQAKQQAEREIKNLLAKQFSTIEKCLKRGDSIEEIADFLEIDVATIESYVDQLK